MDQLQDELTALESIYGDEFHSFSPRCCSITFQLAPGPLSLILEFPTTYPSLETPSPQYTISTTWSFIKSGDVLDLSQEERKSIQKGFDEITESIKGQVVVFEWVEWLRSFLADRYPDAPEVPETECTFANEESPKLSETLETINPGVVIPDIPILTSSTTITDRKSVFIGHCAIVHSKQQVEDFRIKLISNKKIAKATHNIIAYRIAQSPGVYLKDFDDDGETAAGSRLLHLLDLLKMDNMVVCVTRWYGGIHLGPTRFKHILNAARNVLEEGGYVSKSK